MAHVIIWGDPRSVLAGTHAGAVVVRSFAGVQTALDGRGAALVLTGLSELTAEHGVVEAWLKNGASKRVWLVAAADAGDSDGLLERFPFLHDVVARPVSPMRLRITLERAFETMNARGTLLQLQEAYDRRGDELSVLNKIGVQLSAERDTYKLLDLILQKSREITGADAGSLYLVERA